MRIHLRIKTKNSTLPFDHQPQLVGTMHKWLGWNDEHGKLSLYSFSRLDGGRATSKGLQFEDGATMFFSSPDTELIKKMIAGIQSDPSMFGGLTVNEIILQEDPDFTTKEFFYAASPIFIKRRVGELIAHILYDDQRANECLKETILTKMDKANISDESFDICFDTSHPKASYKKINYKGIDNKASSCPVIIKGKPETKAFIWNVGLGNSTGIGFGALK